MKPHAFPTFTQSDNGGMIPETDGMELRDYFAARAMQALIPAFDQKEGGAEEIAARNARAAYLLADAMMEARTKPKEPK